MNEAFDQCGPIFDQTAGASDECRNLGGAPVSAQNQADLASSDDADGFIDARLRFIENPFGSRAAFPMLYSLPSAVYTPISEGQRLWERVDGPERFLPLC